MAKYVLLGSRVLSLLGLHRENFEQIISQEQSAGFSAVQRKVKSTWERMHLWRAGFDLSANITQTADCSYRNRCFPLWQLPYW